MLAIRDCNSDYASSQARKYPILYLHQYNNPELRGCNELENVEKEQLVKADKDIMMINLNSLLDSDNFKLEREHDWRMKFRLVGIQRLQPNGLSCGSCQCTSRILGKRELDHQLKPDTQSYH